MGEPNIILVGFMGTGKTTVGKLLSSRLARTLVDMDAVIEERQKKKISEIFAEEGEAYFRQLERELVQELCARDSLVITPGGGIVLNDANIEDFSRTGLVVCLNATPESILARVEAETHRPLLEGGDKARKITDLLESRQHLYGKIPLQIDTSELDAEAVADRIIELSKN